MRAFEDLDSLTPGLSNPISLTTSISTEKSPRPARKPPTYKLDFSIADVNVPSNQVLGYGYCVRMFGPYRGLITRLMRL